MADATNYNRIVRFVPGGSGAGDDDGEAASVVLELEEPWKHSAGLHPNTNRATCSYKEFANLGASINVSGSIDFCFSDPDDPDLTIDNVTLIDAEPLRYGVPSDAPGGGAIVVQWRLYFVDCRYAFVSPRGGRLTLGLLNPSDNQQLDPNGTNPPQPQTMQQLIQYCLDSMDNGDGSLSGIDIPQTSVLAPTDLKWFGTHAPTELAKLLAMANFVFVLQPTADADQNPVYEIVEVGVGTTPTFPDGRGLPPATLSGIDARGKTVVFTSYPTQIAVTFDSDELNAAMDQDADYDPGGAFQVVYRAKSNGAWVPIDSAGVFGQGTAIAEMNKNFSDLPAQVDDQYFCYRYLQLKPSQFDPRVSPLLRRSWADPTGNSASTSTNPFGLPPQLEIQCRANVAVQDPISGLWTNGSMVTVPILGKIGDQNVLITAMRLVKLKSGVTSTPHLEPNAVAIDLTADIQLRFSIGDSQWDDNKQVFLPAYFYVGFSGAPGATTTLSGDDAVDVLADPDTIVIPIAELQALRFVTGSDWDTEDDPYNQTTLQAYCTPFADRWLKDASKPPQILACVGFVPFTLDGVVGEVTIDQRQLLTRFQINPWFRPAGSYLASEFRRMVAAHHESHPHEAKMQGKRTASSQAGSSQPVEPLSSFSPPSPVGMLYVSVSTDGGAAGSSTTNCTLTYTVNSIGGGDLPDGSNATSTNKTPELNYRFSNVTYAAGSLGIAAYDAGSPPALHLLFVKETPQETPC